MRYRIEYADGRCCNYVNSRKDLLDWLKALKDEKIVDIRKVYKKRCYRFCDRQLSQLSETVKGMGLSNTQEAFENVNE